jgi:hypothetical protein
VVGRSQAKLMRPARWLVGLALVGAACSPPDAVTGLVLDDGNPVEGAVVRIQATARSTVTDADGRFTIEGVYEGVRLSAWSDGYFIAGGDQHPPGDEVTIDLSPIPEGDNPDYEWLSALERKGVGEGQPCVECHHNPGTQPFSLPVDQWLEDAHSQSATNPRFLTMYAGTDLTGNESPPTRYSTNRDYGRVPLRPDPAVPYFGPGYRLDFPDSAGNCAACHVPAAAVDDPYGVDPTAVEGVAREGVTCDVCHKVWDVAFDRAAGLPDSGRPGVLSYEFRRPPAGHQFFAGPYDDVAPGEDTFSPLQLESAFCAPCHHGVFWDVVVYDSYGEWLASAYSDPNTGQTCQDCHMPTTGATHFALPEQGGMTRDPATIPGHRMPGAADLELLQNAVTMGVDASIEMQEVLVEVTITNDRTGHDVPTDSPLRHLILLVEVTDDAGHQLEQTDGPTVPVWGGVGDPGAGHYGGLPGTAYAKVLEELWTEVAPTGAYWNPTRVVSDNRIAALEADKTAYRFTATSSGDVAVEVTLLFRRAFIELMEQKGWDVPDIVMEQAEVVVRRPVDD